MEGGTDLVASNTGVAYASVDDYLPEPTYGGISSSTIVTWTTSDTITVPAGTWVNISGVAVPGTSPGGVVWTGITEEDPWMRCLT